MKIERCRIAHLHALLGTLRDEERSEIAAIGGKPRHVLLRLWKLTPDPLAAVDPMGGVLAVWGDAAATLAMVGYPWVFTSNRIERYPLFFFREVRRQIRKMLVSREALACDIGANCPKALRFYRMIGFEIGDEFDGFHRATIKRGG